MTINVGVHEKEKFTLQDVMNNIKKDPDYHKAGAIALFIGIVRGETLNSQRVEKLSIEAYEEKANQVLTQIRNDLMKKHGVVNVQIHHLLGEFQVGEDLVYVAVAGAHRTDVFPVLREAVERYKTEVPVFKKEYIIDEQGSASGYWVSEKEHNH